MNNNKLVLKPTMFAVYSFLAYYCLYELLGRFSPIGTSNAYYVVFISAIVLNAAMLLEVFMIASNIAGRKRRVNMVFIAWLPFVAVLTNQAMNKYCNKSYLLLFTVFVLLLFSSSGKMELWKKVIKALIVLAYFSVVGILCQLIAPSIHRFIISLFYSANGVQYISSYANRGYYSGFFHQVGVTAFYLSAGIISSALLTENKRKRRFEIVLFSLALIMEGKRSIPFILALVLLLAYILNGKGSKKLVRISISCVIVIFIMFILRMVSLSLSNIKLFEKINYTLAYLEEGNIDNLLYTSGRSWLYDEAIRLFLTKPINGIGWAEFSKMSTSINSRGTSVHNIYLQLLCETGVIGFCTFVFGGAITLFHLIRFYIRVRNRRLSETDQKNKYLLLSICGQMMFLLYGLVENPLYNDNCVMMYFLMTIMGCSIYMIEKMYDMSNGRC